MTKSKNNKSEAEQLKNEIKKLRKQLSRQKKRSYTYEDLETKEAEILLKEELAERRDISTKDQCPKCKGVLDKIEGPKLKIFICPDCNYRSTVRVT